MTELVDRDGQDKGEPDCQGGGDVLVDPGYQEDVLRGVDPRRFGPEEKSELDRDKEDECDPGRDDHHHDHPERGVEPEQRREPGEPVEEPHTLGLYRKDRAVEDDRVPEGLLGPALRRFRKRDPVGSLALPGSLPGINIAGYEGICRYRQEHVKEPVHSCIFCGKST
ncbi:MAG: hypothetical protein A4E37_00059 [Methanoregulaceae archaeon PtaB.Bin056]|nr:MAG: hypothetical protein A4E37_00059 [Methanoregulaceae archaeon PtaB.Bin056]